MHINCFSLREIAQRAWHGFFFCLIFSFVFWERNFCEFSVSHISCIFIASDPALDVIVLEDICLDFQRYCLDLGKIILNWKKLTSHRNDYEITRRYIQKNAQKVFQTDSRYGENYSTTIVLILAIRPISFMGILYDVFIGSVHLYLSLYRGFLLWCVSVYIYIYIHNFLKIWLPSSAQDFSSMLTVLIP